MADSATSDRIEAIRGVHTLEALYEQAGKINVTPGWLRRDQTSPAGKQQSEYVPAHWRYDVCKAALDAAGRLIDVSRCRLRIGATSSCAILSAAMA
jgi:gentisate 1,2-dioxygenase